MADMNIQGLEMQFLGWHEQFSDAIFRYCFFRLSDKEKAKDATQETFIRLWKYVSVGKEVVNVRAILYKIANNLIIDEYRRKETFSLDQMQEETGFDIGYDVRDYIEIRDEYKRALKIIENLPVQYREAFTMRHIDGMSVKEIAHITGESENVISVRIHRSIGKLRNLEK